MIEITQELLHKLFSYDKTTGNLIRKIQRQRVKAGDIAGNKTKSGYIRINIEGRLVMAHRLIWLHVYGTYPVREIDHINGIRDDNRLENLRLATRRENTVNTYKHRAGRLEGTSYQTRDNVWHSKINIDGKTHYLGSFTSELEAHQVYMRHHKAAIKKDSYSSANPVF